MVTKVGLSEMRKEEKFKRRKYAEVTRHTAFEMPVLVPIRHF
jgi:hypothetical protein